MKQLLFGYDYAGVPALKITKGSINPALEPDENVGSFLYNSKWAADYKITGIELIPAVGGNTFVPAGSGLSNYTMYRELTYPSGQAAYIRKAHFPDLPYEYPLCEVKARRISNGRFIGSMVMESLSGYERYAGNWRTPGREWFGWGSDMTVYYNATAGYIDYGTHVLNYFSQPGGLTTEAFYSNLVVWRLPGDEADIIDGAPQAPVDGAHVIEIDNAGVRIAKPGFDVRTATPTQMALDTANHPTKVIGAADVSCPLGVSSYDIGVTIPENAVADVHFYENGIIVYPANPIASPYGGEYWFEGSTIFFNNQFGECRVRFIIYALGTDGPTSGNNDIIRQFTDGSQDVFQILRPGASANPSLDDIVIDSRLPCIQILKEGYIGVDLGEQSHAIDFDGHGCFPMVKYMTCHGGGSRSSGGLVENWSKRVRMPFVNACGTYKNGWAYSMGGDSTFCTLTNTQAVFHTYRGAPIRRYYANFQDWRQNRISYEYDPSPIYGIRYYILGIPA